MKPRNCPHCNTTLGIEENFDFDEVNNLICGSCGGVVYPATVVSETDFETKLRATKSPTTTTTTYYGAWQIFPGPTKIYPNNYVPPVTINNYNNKIDSKLKPIDNNYMG